MRIALISAVAASLVGCASVFNPYVRPYPDADKSDAVGTNGSFEHPAVQQARQVQGRLAQHLSEHAWTNSVSGSVLLSLASLVAYKGATGGAPHNIAALSTAGFAGYSTIQYLNARPRELVYVTGIAAIDCAVRLTQPYLWASNASEDEVMRKLGELKSHLVFSSNQLGFAAAVESARRETAWLEARLMAATARKRQRAEQSRNYEAQLIAATFGIVGEVNKQVAFQSPDPGRLQAQVAGLALPAKPPAPAQPAGSGPQPETADRDLAAVQDVLVARRKGHEKKRDSLNAQKSRIDLALSAHKEKIVEVAILAVSPTAQSESSVPSPNNAGDASRIKRLEDERERVGADLSDVERELDELTLANTAISKLQTSLATARLGVEVAEGDIPPEPVPPSEIDYAACGIEKPTDLFSAQLVVTPAVVAIPQGGQTALVVSGVGQVPRIQVAFGPGDTANGVTAAMGTIVSGVGKLVVAAAMEAPVGVYALLVETVPIRVEVTATVPES